jgi:hypothetical protein
MGITVSNQRKNRFKLPSSKLAKNVYIVLGISGLIIAAVLVPQGFKKTASTGTDTITLSPASGVYNTGSTISVAINVTSTTDLIDSVQASLTYTSGLTFNSITVAPAFASLCGQSAGGAGVVNISCATSGATGLTGTNLFATVNFTLNATSGTAGVSVGSASQIYVYNNQGINQWNGVVSTSTYTVSLPPTVSLTTPAAGEIHNSVVLTANPVDQSGKGITKVDFYLNGTTLLATDTTSPYTYTLNTLTETDGAFTLTAKATDGNGGVTTSSAVAVTIGNGDINGDGHVNLTDLQLLATNYSKAGTFATGDLNLNGTVDLGDLQILAINYGF